MYRLKIHEAVSMDDLRHQKKEGSAISDRLRFNTKPIAVRSENLVSSIKATNGNIQTGDGVSTIIFDIPAMSGGYYLDAASTRFSFNLMFTDSSNVATSIDALKYIWLDRGPNSIINRFQLYDQSGHLLEDLQNYHLLYGLEKVCTGDWGVQTQRNAFFKEARFTNSAAAAALSEDAACGGAVYKSPQLVGVVGAFTQDAYEGLVANNVATNIPLTLTFHSSIFGSGSDKYFPLSAMNGFRLVLTLNSPNSSFQVDVGHSQSFVLHTHQSYTGSIQLCLCVLQALSEPVSTVCRFGGHSHLSCPCFRNICRTDCGIVESMACAPQRSRLRHSSGPRLLPGRILFVFDTYNKLQKQCRVWSGARILFTERRCDRVGCERVEQQCGITPNVFPSKCAKCPLQLDVLCTLRLFLGY